MFDLPFLWLYDVSSCAASWNNVIDKQLIIKKKQTATMVPQIPMILNSMALNQSVISNYTTNHIDLC